MVNSSTKVPILHSKRIPDLELRNLCQLLWGWEYCANCAAEQACSDVSCSWSRKSEINTFLQFYASETSSILQDKFACRRSALKTHRDLIDLIQLLKENSHIPRVGLVEKHLQRYSNDSRPGRKDLGHAFEVAVGIMTMVDCAAKHRSWSQCELGLSPVIWRNEQSLEQFLETVLPKGKSPPLFVRQLSAKRVKRAGLTFRGTENLTSHLNLDRESGVLWIFHDTRFLKLHLSATRDHDGPDSVGSTEKEIFPRGLALEVLDSLEVIFSRDNGSRKILRGLVAKEKFDPDCLQPVSSKYRRASETEKTFFRLGSRLEDVYREVEDPTPRGLQRLNAGIVIAIIVGILGLVVGVVQVWISYQQWKHPVMAPTS